MVKELSPSCTEQIYNQAFKLEFIFDEQFFQETHVVCLWKPSNQSSLIFGREQLVDLTNNCSIEGKLLFRTQFCSTKDKDKDHEKMAECFSCNKAVTSHHLLTVGGKYKMQSWKRRFKPFDSCPKLLFNNSIFLSANFRNEVEVFCD